MCHEATQAGLCDVLLTAPSSDNHEVDCCYAQDVAAEDSFQSTENEVVFERRADFPIQLYDVNVDRPPVIYDSESNDQDADNYPQHVAETADAAAPAGAVSSQVYISD